MLSRGVQGRLTLVTGGGRAWARPSVDQASIASLTSDLVRIPSQGGIDDQAPALRQLAGWLERHGVHANLLEAPGRKPRNRPIGLLVGIGPERAPVVGLTACLDTAPFGEEDTWDGRKPTAATRTEDGWMVGRGSADSKVGVAIFATLIAELKQHEQDLNGRILLLVDSDEHTGRFGAVKRLVQDHPELRGLYIGYPGHDTLKVGARGFYRAKVSMYGLASHSGASNPSRQNAVEKAARLIEMLGARPLRKSSDSEFGLDPQRTVTAVAGGKGYSNVPDYGFIRVDYRLTPEFTSAAARQDLREAVAALDAAFPTVRDSRVDPRPSWPAYKLRADNPLVSALADAAEQEFGQKPALRVSGPSNVGNYLSSMGIDATCGFGVTYRNIHAANEAIKLDSIMPVYRSYRRAILDLFSH